MLKWRKVIIYGASDTETNFPEIRGFGMGINLTILSVEYFNFQVLIIVHNNKKTNKYRGI